MLKRAFVFASLVLALGTMAVPPSVATPTPGRVAKKALYTYQGTITPKKGTAKAYQDQCQAANTSEALSTLQSMHPNENVSGVYKVE